MATAEQHWETNAQVRPRFGQVGANRPRGLKDLPRLWRQPGSASPSLALHLGSLPRQERLIEEPGRGLALRGCEPRAPILGVRHRDDAGAGDRFEGWLNRAG